MDHRVCNIIRINCLIHLKAYFNECYQGKTLTVGVVRDDGQTWKLQHILIAFEEYPRERVYIYGVWIFIHLIGLYTARLFFVNVRNVENLLRVNSF